MAILLKTPVISVGFNVFVALLAAWGLGCETPNSANQDPLQIGSKTLEFTLTQRMSQTVPGVMGRISLKLGDIETGRGVEDLEVIDHKDESSVASTPLLRKGDVVGFKIDGAPYVLQLVSYDATHFVSDRASFTLRLGR